MKSNKCNFLLLQTIVVISTFFIVNSAVAQPSLESTIASKIIEVHQVGNSDNLNFCFLKSVLKDNRIVLLGEAGHGDGETFTIKVNMVKYLSDSLGYKTIVLEGSNFFDSYVFTHKLEPDSLVDMLNQQKGIEMVWDWQWAYAKETSPLVNLILNKKINCIGMDNQPNFDSRYLIEYLYKYCSSAGDVLPKSEWTLLDSIHTKFMYHVLHGILGKENKDTMHIYTTDFKKIMNFLKSSNRAIGEQRDFFIQSIENALSFVKENDVFANIHSQADVSDALDKSNAIRDSEMYSNVNYYVEKHPKEKIIIWTANFHGCRALKNIQYRPTDTMEYKKYQVLGGYLSGKYKSAFNSMAFTSFEGTVGSVPDNTLYPIDTSYYCLEKELGKSKDAYGFIDFESIRDNPLYNKKFSTRILGYNPKEGYWLTAFDGVFYIRNQHAATSTK